MKNRRGQNADANAHLTWRLAAATRAARAYAANPELAALAVAGSVGSGLADRFPTWSSTATGPRRRETLTAPARFTPSAVS